MTRYLCPSCSSTAQPEHHRCLVCGYETSDEEQTWVVESDASPSGETKIFQERYELRNELGRGAMGIVFKAFDRELEEVIALKALAPTGGLHPDLVARFKHEVKVARRLTHPNIARLHDLVEIRGQLYLSMELIEGLPLRQVLEQQGPLASERALGYIKAILSALEPAHALGIVHRDLKPSNIIIDGQDAPRILDFGIAKSEWLPEPNDDSPIGTPAYMAPEQWALGAVDGRADLYSVGVMFYEMVCGKRPFEHRNRLLLMEMHLTRAPRPPRELRPDLPERLEQVILRLLEKEPGRRYARARDVLNALEPQVRETPVPPAKDRLRGPTPPVSLGHGARGKVLIADDDPTLRRILGAQVRAHNLLVLEAEDGGKAVETALREIPDLILVDVRMPIIDGLETLRLIKKDARTRDIPVVVMSGLGDSEQVAFSKENGAASFLQKPISRDVIELLVERYFG